MAGRCPDSVSFLSSILIEPVTHSTILESFPSLLYNLAASQPFCYIPSRITAGQSFPDPQS
jgi:hypothetical protein